MAEVTVRAGPASCARGGAGGGRGEAKVLVITVVVPPARYGRGGAGGEGRGLLAAATSGCGRSPAYDVYHRAGTAIQDRH